MLEVILTFAVTFSNYRIQQNATLFEFFYVFMFFRHFLVKKTCNILYKFSVLHSHFNLIKIFYFYSLHWGTTSCIDPNMTQLIDLVLFCVRSNLIRGIKYNYKFTYLYISLDWLVFPIAEVLQSFFRPKFSVFKQKIEIERQHEDKKYIFLVIDLIGIS